MVCKCNRVESNSSLSYQIVTSHTKTCLVEPAVIPVFDVKLSLLRSEKNIFESFGLNYSKKK